MSLHRFFNLLEKEIFFNKYAEWFYTLLKVFLNGYWIFGYCIIGNVYSSIQIPCRLLQMGSMIIKVENFVTVSHFYLGKIFPHVELKSFSFPAEIFCLEPVYGPHRSIREYFFFSLTNKIPIELILWQLQKN